MGTVILQNCGMAVFFYSRAYVLFIFSCATRSRSVKSAADAKLITFVKHRRFSRVTYGNINSTPTLGYNKNATGFQ